MKQADRMPSRTGAVVAVFSLGLAAGAFIVAADQLGLSASPVCGARCLDEEVAAGIRNARKIEAARAAADAQTLRSPFDGRVGLRRALLEWRAAGVWTEAASRALNASYRRDPVDPTILSWRAGLAFTQWANLSQDTRRRAAGEIAVLHQATQTHPVLRRLAGDIQSEEGRFAYAMLLGELEERAQRRDGRATPTANPRLADQIAAIAGS